MVNAKLYPIKAVAKITGLSQHVIRAWEKRYNAVTPKRSESNRRLYISADVDKLILLKRAIEAGYSIGNIATLETSEIRSIVNQGTDAFQEFNAPTPVNGAHENINQFLENTLQAIEELNPKKLENILLTTSVRFSQPVLIDNFIIPFLQRIGNLWQEGKIRIYHEHLTTAAIKTFLVDLINKSIPPENAPNVIATTPTGQFHELGALIAALTAANTGRQVAYLGPNLPAEEIAAAAIDKQSVAVLLSIIFPGNDPRLTRELEKLRNLLPENVEIYVGGRSVNSYHDTLKQINARIFQEIRDLREKLSEFIAV
jgi:DNA-binding transcriptional MerR regulator/methylmalonyl-CoA mutase cobalamin-binding subunit